MAALVALMHITAPRDRPKSRGASRPLTAAPRFVQHVRHQPKKHAALALTATSLAPKELVVRRSRRNLTAYKSRMRRQRKPTILCIDNDVVGSTLRQALLQRAGYRVLTAGSGTQGLEMAKCHRVDLVLVDFEMPDLNGFAVAALLRGIPPKKRIVMLSGHESKASKGFPELDGFISKGTRVEAFLASVARHLHP
jgi:CheY-like chemotaxis protein